MSKALFSWILLLLLAMPAVMQAQVFRQQQQDYVLTTAGDTLRGRIQVVRKPVKTIWLYRTGQPTATFTANELRGYGDARGLLETTRQVGPRGESEFVSVLVSGYVSLFVGTAPDGAIRFFLQPADSAYVVAVSRETPRLSYLRVMGNECSKLDFSDARLENKYRYSPTGLTQLVNDYNVCRQQPSQMVANTGGGLRVLFGIQAGANSSLSSRSSSGAVGYQVGVFFQATNKSALAFRMEPTYSKIHKTYGPENIFNGYAPYTTTRIVDINYAQLQLPLVLRYTVGHGALRPHVAGGVLGALNFRNKSVVSIKNSDKPAAVVSPIDYPSSSSIGATAGIGLSLYQAKGPTPGLELRYDYVPGDSDIYTELSLNIIRLNFSILF